MIQRGKYFWGYRSESNRLRTSTRRVPRLRSRIALHPRSRAEIIILTMRPFFAIPCFSVVAAFAQNTTAPDVFFLQMSDPQFGMYANNRDFAQETANYEFAIAT